MVEGVVGYFPAAVGLLETADPVLESGGSGKHPWTRQGSRIPCVRLEVGRGGPERGMDLRQFVDLW